MSGRKRERERARTAGLDCAVVLVDAQLAAEAVCLAHGLGADLGQQGVEYFLHQPTLVHCRETQISTEGEREDQG
jgi:hypothetical protein